MNRAIACAALGLLVACSAMTQDTSKELVTSSVEQLCSDSTAASAKQLDCKATGSVAVSAEPSRGDSKKQPEPRLGYIGNPWIITGF